MTIIRRSLPNLAHYVQTFPNLQKLFIFNHGYFIRLLNHDVGECRTKFLYVILNRNWCNVFATRANDELLVAAGDSHHAVLVDASCADYNYSLHLREGGGSGGYWILGYWGKCIFECIFCSNMFLDQENPLYGRDNNAAKG